MATRRNKITKRNRTRRMRGGKKSKTGKKWVTAIDAASATLAKTGSINAAKKSLKKQALFNARKLFGSVGV
jgi:soluble cytochrome b562